MASNWGRGWLNAGVAALLLFLQHEPHHVPDERPTGMIHIVTDSTCECPAEVLHHPQVDVLPLSVMFGKESLRDGLDISVEQFWERLPLSSTLPTTSQATPGDFARLFERYTDAGDEVVAIVLSSKLSGTHESAVMAQNSLPGRPIDVIDSLTVSVGLGRMVEQALDMVLAGATRDEIVAKMLRMRENIHVLFYVDTLEYIQKGGRIGRATAFVGTLLKFKPLLSIKDGEVYPVTRVRSKRKALETMIDILTTELPVRGPRVKLAVVHARAETEAAEVAAQLKERFVAPDVFTTALGPVLGVHVGPGTIGALAYAEED
jgi:DegV family protein with EDD domain